MECSSQAGSHSSQQDGVRNSGRTEIFVVDIDDDDDDDNP